MVTAICLNPCIDRTVTIPEFRYGGMNRIQSVRQDASGKGVNVAIAARQIGMQGACIGFMGEQNGDMVVKRLEENGCQAEFIAVPGAVRLNTKVLDLSKDVVTEINEGGRPVTVEQVEQAIAQVVRWAQKTRFLVLTGSMPPGCPKDLYGQMIARVHEAAPQCRCVLDAEGEVLVQGLKQHPYLIKPNQYELELLFGRPMERLEDVKAAAMDLCDHADLVAVSMGGQGALFTNGTMCMFAPAMDVEVKSTVGAGDSMVAGLLHGLEQSLPLVEVFACGVAAASSSVMTPGTELIDDMLYRQLIPDARKLVQNI